MSSPPASITGSPPPSLTPKKSSRWNRVGTLVRRSSTAFSIPGVARTSSPSPSEQDRDSDSVSVKAGSIRGGRSSSSASIKQLDTAGLSPPANGSHMAPSPIAESPMREAAALASEPSAHLGPSPLADGTVISSSPQESTGASATNETTAPVTPIAPDAVVTEEPEEIAPASKGSEAQSEAPSVAEEPAPRYTTMPSLDAEEQKGSSSSTHVAEDVAVEQPVTEAVPAPATDAPQVEAPVSETPASVKAPSVAEEVATEEQLQPTITVVEPTPFVEDPVHSPVPAIVTQSAIPQYFDMPAPSPIIPPPISQGGYGADIWGGTSLKAVSAKPSNASLHSAGGWSQAPSNGNASHGPPIVVPAINPFADPQPNEPVDGLSPSDTIRIPEPVDPRSPREEDYAPVISMPLPSFQDVLPAQSAQSVPRGYTVSANNSAGPTQSGYSNDERIPLLAAPAHAGQSKTYNGNGNSSGKAANGHDAAPRLHALGWIEYVLPDAAIYYVHPTLRVTTDINLRNLKQLEIVTSYLERNGEGFKVPQGYELWLRDAAEGKRRECVPVRNWVDHIQRHISFEGPEERHAHHHLHEDDKLDAQYRYWSFMEAHPAHAGLSLAAHAEATDALTWSYTDRLLPSSLPVPPPFTQAECQELMALLRSFGATPDTTGVQTIVHTRIVSRILLRTSAWRQMHFRPHRALPQDTHKPRRPHPKTSIIRTISDFLIGIICLGLPWLFVERSNHHQIDIESGLHTAGPMLVIGACSCLVAAIILSASVTFMSFPGLDDIARLAGFIAILCSAASMTSSVIALFRYKADMERTMWHYDMAGAGMMTLTKRSILLSLPLVFLAYSIAGFIAAIVIYSFRGVSTMPPGEHSTYGDYTKWTVIGTLGGLAGVLAVSALASRR